MKVIGIDNYDRETVSDIVVAENLTENEAKGIANNKNEEAEIRYGSDNQPIYYVVRDDDYKPFNVSDMH